LSSTTDWGKEARVYNPEEEKPIAVREKALSVLEKRETLPKTKESGHFSWRRKDLGSRRGGIQKRSKSSSAIHQEGNG